MENKKEFQEIFDNYMVRNSNKQKNDFTDYFIKECSKFGYTAFREEGYNKNIIVGDVENASILCTAHYDTCKNIFFENIYYPFNRVTSVAGTVIRVFWLPLLLGLLAFYIFNEIYILLLFILVPILMDILSIFNIGINNSNNYNDNTSGIITLLSIMKSLEEDKKKNVAFILFDNEEKGCWGSKEFNKRYKKTLDNKLIVNFDCVADGDFILLSYKNIDTKLYNSLNSIFFENSNKYNIKPLISEKSLINSDNKSFEKSIGIESLNQTKKFKKLYTLNKIHTKKDTVFEQNNINYVTDCICMYIDSLTNEKNA